MKKGKIILGAAVGILAITSAFVVKAKNFAAATLQTKGGTLVNCARVTSGSLCLGISQTYQTRGSNHTTVITASQTQPKAVAQ